MNINLTVSRLISKIVLVAMISLSAGCYHYRVLNTNNDPATEYKKEVVWSYFWGLVNKPKDLHVPNCTSSNALDEVEYSKKFGQCLLTVFTLGIVSPVEIKWKCHKPCRTVGGGL